jgi:hypothetical protein
MAAMHRDNCKQCTFRAGRRAPDRLLAESRIELF